MKRKPDLRLLRKMEYDKTPITESDVSAFAALRNIVWATASGYPAWLDRIFNSTARLAGRAQEIQEKDHRTLWCLVWGARRQLAKETRLLRKCREILEINPLAT